MVEIYASTYSMCKAILLDGYLLSCQCTFNIGIIQGQGEAGCYGYK